MSDELFRDTNRPGATWFMDCSKKKCQFWGLNPADISFSLRKKKWGKSVDFRQTPVDLRPVGVRGVLPQKERLLLET